MAFAGAHKIMGQNVEMILRSTGVLRASVGSTAIISDRHFAYGD